MTVAVQSAIKICGLTRAGDAAHAAAAGADYIGVILANGVRVLDLPRAAVVLGPRHHGVRRVAVFGTQSADEIIDAVHRLDLDVAQLHGAPSARDAEYIRAATGRAVWPVLRVEGTSLPHEATDLADATGYLVLDAKVHGQLGGTGVVLDWTGLAEALAAVRRAVPSVRLVLAGGLRPGNVAEAIRLLAPDVVDVSSGVETSPGVKDPVAVERFVHAVRNATGNPA